MKGEKAKRRTRAELEAMIDDLRGELETEIRKHAASIQEVRELSLKLRGDGHQQNATEAIAGERDRAVSQASPR